jgi:hypothetical protein
MEANADRMTESVVVQQGGWAVIADWFARVAISGNIVWKRAIVMGRISCAIQFLGANANWDSRGINATCLISLGVSNLITNLIPEAKLLGS